MEQCALCWPCEVQLLSFPAMKSTRLLLDRGSILETLSVTSEEDCPRPPQPSQKVPANDLVPEMSSSVGGRLCCLPGSRQACGLGWSGNVEPR